MDKRLLTGAMLLGTLLTAPAKSAEYQLLRANAEIAIDGNLDEPIWQQATVIPLNYEAYPNHGEPARTRTEALLFEDGEYLYIAIKAYDDNPEKIRAAFRAHDSLWADDNVGILLDTFNTQRNAYEFFINPYGAQADVLMDDTDGWKEDDSWDAIWDSAGKITDQGYQVEVAIPFSALRFPDQAGEQTWNIAFWRSYPRTLKSSSTSFPRDRDSKCTICQFDQIKGFADIDKGHALQLTPTLTVGRADQRNVQGEWQNGDTKKEVGLDVRWGVTQDIVLNATINPDFSNVEADDGQLDVNNINALFYNEKRPFFLDGADYFNTAMFDFVHTRNIVSPDIGAKVTGKLDSHSFGVLMADDSRTNFLLPGSQSSRVIRLDQSSKNLTARYKTDIGERSYAGVLMTNRRADGYSNDMISIDGVAALNDSHTLLYQFARSDSDNSAFAEEFGLQNEQSGNAFAGQYNYRTGEHSAYVTYNRVDQDFRSDLGFQRQADFEKLIIGGSRTWYIKGHDWINQVRINGDWDKTYRLSDNQMLEQELEGYASVNGLYESYVRLGFLARERFYVDQVFDERQVNFFAEAKLHEDVYLNLFVNVGDQLDFDNVQLGDGFYADSYFNWQVTEQWELQLSQFFDKLDVDGGQLYKAYLADAVLLYQMDMRNQFRLNVQYTDISRNPLLYNRPEFYSASETYVQTQFLYSYKVNPQTLIYVGYGDFGMDDPQRNKFVRSDRAVFAKFSYAWQY